MTEFKIKDNTQNNKSKFQEIGQVTDKIVDKTLDVLEKEGIFIFPELKDAQDVTKDQMILQSVNDSYQSSNLMGFLGYDDERLIIESRFSTGVNDYFFQYLLEHVLDFPNIVELTTDANQEDQLFNLLLFLFPYYLKTAMRKGGYKTYIQTQYNNGNVKGTIDVARHITQNTPFIGKVAYNQREFAYDNDMMELIRHTIEFIKHKPYGKKILRKSNSEVVNVTSVTTNYAYYDRKKIIDKNKKTPIRHAYFHEYRVLQRLCIMILQNDKHQISSGPKQIYGILFDGAWLWEEYINTLINENFHHPMNKGGKGAQQLFTSNGGKTGLIYPDFLSKTSESRVIADTKYKPSGNIHNKDYLQVLAYMYRFDAKYGYYIHPETSGESQMYYLNEGSTYEKNVKPREDVFVTKLGLRVPQDAPNYDEFKVQMSVSEDELKMNLKS